MNYSGEESLREEYSVPCEHDSVWPITKKDDQIKAWKLHLDLVSSYKNNT